MWHRVPLVGFREHYSAGVAEDSGRDSEVHGVVGLAQGRTADGRNGVKIFKGTECRGIMHMSSLGGVEWWNNSYEKSHTVERLRFP